MNFVDLILFSVIAIFMLIGMYKGFVKSTLRVISFLVSFIGSFILYPVFAKLIFLNEAFTKNFRFYAEGMEKLADLELANVNVASLTSEEMISIVNDSVAKTVGGLKAPLNTGVLKNMENLVFEGKFATVGEYFNETIVEYGINVLCFIVAFFLIKMVINIILNVCENSNHIPTLKQYDILAGGVMGIFEGVLILFICFSIVPLFLNIMSVQAIEELLSTSLLGNLFTKGNIIPRLIKYVI